MKATQRPEYLSSSSHSPSPKLPLEIAREEQELALKASKLASRKIHHIKS